jgi:hypothetical protein
MSGRQPPTGPLLGEPVVTTTLFSPAVEFLEVRKAVHGR